MKIFGLSLSFAFVSIFLNLSAADVDIDFSFQIDENGEPQEVSFSSPDDSSMSVAVMNDHDEDVKLFWLDVSRDEEYLMDVIRAGNSYNMKTFVGHSFNVRRDEDDSLLRSFIIVRGVWDYSTESPRRAVISSSQEEEEDVLAASAADRRKHPSVIDVPGHRTTATAVIFRSLSTRHLQIWYDDRSAAGRFSGDFLPGGQSTTNAYFGHKFFFTEKTNVSNRIATVEITADRVLYVIRDDDEHTVASELIEKTEREELFMKEYLARTGIHWRHHYGAAGPRPPPVLYMWPASAVGQRHKVTTSNSHWSCNTTSKCQSTESISLELEVVSLAPRVFIIENFLNDFEAEHVISLAKDNVRVSMVGDGATGHTSETRTSRNSWLTRSRSAVVDTLFRRAADVLNLDEAILSPSRNAEEIQVVHYKDMQRYEAHHDWGASQNHGNSRFITMLMYLTDQEVPSNGGETAFPKGGTAGGGFKVKPVKGDAVLFYNLLEDGNGDDLALHAALPVTSGEKWLANFWVWDPVKNFSDD